MLNIPEQYQVNQKIAPKTILTGDLKPVDKKRLKSCLKSVYLTHQIQGETIPSYLDDRYRYEVILFLEIQMDTIKNAELAAPLFHRLFKSPCIILVHNGVQGVVSLAAKRLSRNNDQEIVIEEQVVAPPQPLTSFRSPASIWGKTMDFNAILNTSNKRGFYIEVMIKAFIAGYSSLYSRMQEFLHTPVWYNSTTVMTLFEKLDALRILSLQKDKAVQTKDKVALNQQMKAVMKDLEEMLSLLLTTSQ